MSVATLAEPMTELSEFDLDVRVELDESTAAEGRQDGHHRRPPVPAGGLCLAGRPPLIRAG